MPEPEFQLGSGERVQATVGGSVGCGLTWTGGDGFAMAGHVAPMIGSTVGRGSTKVGAVVWASNPTGAGQSALADFSVVQLDPGVSFQSLGPARASAKPYDIVELIRSGTNSYPQAIIVGMFPAMGLLTHNCLLGNIYLTNRQISSGGDSGAPVRLQGTGGVIGHIIGVSPNFSTLIQDLDYQLSAATPALPGLTIR